jgi:hypothetical protein
LDEEIYDSPYAMPPRDQEHQTAVGSLSALCAVCLIECVERVWDTRDDEEGSAFESEKRMGKRGRRQVERRGR